MVTKHFQDQHQRELRAEREDVQRMRRVASSLAKMVREFWSNIEKVRNHAVDVVCADDGRRCHSLLGHIAVLRRCCPFLQTE